MSIDRPDTSKPKAALGAITKPGVIIGAGAALLAGFTFTNHVAQAAPGGGSSGDHSNRPRGTLNAQGEDIARMIYETVNTPPGSADLREFAIAWLRMGGTSTADAQRRFDVLAGLAHRARTFDEFLDILNGRTPVTDLTPNEMKMMESLIKGSPDEPAQRSGYWHTESGRTWEGSEPD
jgi:hypothetical protein